MLTVVIPTFNERDNLKELVPRVLQLGRDFRVLIVDDNSPDGTGEAADSLAWEFPSYVKVIHRERRTGLGTAYMAGLRRALDDGADYVVTMDADLAHDPAMLPRFWDALQTFDAVVGSRYKFGISVVEWPIRRVLLSYLANVYVSTVSGLLLADCTSRYVGYRRDALQSVDLDRIRSGEYAFIFELKLYLQRAGCRICEIPIVYYGRRRGQTKMSSKAVVEAAIRPWQLVVAGPRGHTLPLHHPPLGEIVHLRDGAVMPSVTVIVPVQPGNWPTEVIASIRQQTYPLDRIQVIVVEGNQPSVQRNRAAAQATGEVFYFLDDDSVLPEGALIRALTWFNDPDVAVVGGPVLTSGRDTLLQQCFGAALGSLFGSFSSRNRFASRGFPRVSGEQEMISANMAVRAWIFHREGGFDERLYPNEECEFLNRLRAKGYRVVHDPALRAYRHQRENLRQFARQVFRYGRGRMEHFWVNPSFFNPIFLVPLVFVLYILTLPLSYSHWGMLAFFPLLLYGALDMISSLLIVISNRSPAMLLIIPILFPVIHISYGVGLAWGIVSCWWKLKSMRMPTLSITEVAVSTAIGSSEHKEEMG